MLLEFHIKKSIFCQAYEMATAAGASFRKIWYNFNVLCSCAL